MNYKQRIQYLYEYSEIANKMLFDLKQFENIADVEEFNKAISSVERKYVEQYSDHFTQTPGKLYKYRSFSFDGYTFDMLENQYLYLSPMRDLDDTFEATINNEIVSTENLTQRIHEEKTYYKLIKSLLLKYNAFSKKAFACFSIDTFIGMPDDLVQARSISLASYDYLYKKHGLSYEDIYRINNMIKYWMYNPNFIEQAIKLIESYRDTKEKTGVCSLAASFQNSKMWNLYADNNQGCCIEYVLDKNDPHNIVDVVPVLYKNNRNYDTIDFLIDCYVETFEKGYEQYIGKIMTQYRIIANTKDVEWEYQDEWRIIGEPRKKSPAPKISAIYLGYNISKENKNRIVSISKKINACVYQLDEHNQIKELANLI